MPRVIWKGAIRFGLVHVPVVVHAATSRTGIEFDLVHRKTANPIGYRKIDKVTGKEVAREDVVRAYEYEGGHYVMLGDDELKSANVEAAQSVDVLAFVGEHAIPSPYFDTPYYLLPDKRGEKVYALFRETLRKRKKVAVATVVLHTRQHLAALAPAGELLILNTLRWGEEVVDLAGLEVPRGKGRSDGPSAQELAMASKLVDEMSTEWDPDAYRDTYRDDVLALVEKKVAAGKTHLIEAIEPADVPSRASTRGLDLAELLKQSLRSRSGPERSKRGSTRAPAARAKKKAAPKKASTKARPAPRRRAAGRARRASSGWRTISGRSRSGRGATTARGRRGGC